MDTFWCTPSTIEGRQFTSPLRGTDSGLLFVMEVPICWAWKDKQLDANVLKQALDKTLDRFPIAAARIVPKHRHLSPITKFAFSELIFSNVGSKGALLEIQTVPEVMPKESAPSVAWNKYFPPHTFRILGEPFNIPLFAARLTKFSDGGCCLCVSITHALADGAAILNIMSTWSYYCGVVNNSEVIFPKECPPSPVLTRAIEDLTEFTKDLPNVEPGIAGRYRTAFGGGILNAHLISDTVVDFKLQTEDMAMIKQILSEKLEKPKWISSYEAIMSVLLRSLATADKREVLSCRALINIRGRTKIAHKDYFGNALSYHKFTFNNAGEISETAYAFHESLRGALQDPTSLEHSHLHAEYLKRNGGHSNAWDRARWTRPFFHSVWEGEPVVNSWVGFDLFNMDFGMNGVKPHFLRVATSFRNHRHIHLYPTTPDGDLAVRMQLSSSSMKRFKKALKDSGFGEYFTEGEPLTSKTNNDANSPALIVEENQPLQIVAEPEKILT